MKVLLVAVVLAAASLVACGGEDPAQRSAAAPESHTRSAAPTPRAEAAIPAASAKKRKRAQARQVISPSAAPGQAVEVAVRPGTKLSQIRQGVRQMLAHHPAKPHKKKGRPLVRLTRPSSQQTAPAHKKGPSLLERLAQGKLPGK